MERHLKTSESVFVYRRSAFVLPFVGLSFLCVGLTGCASIPSTSVGPSALRPLISPGLTPIRTVVLDPGHGGYDPGTSHHGLLEKDLTLDIARRLRDELKSEGLSVVMTRDHDEFIKLQRRAAIANHLPADLFVSVHVNANRRRSVSGIEVYYPRESVLDPSASWPPGLQPEDVALATTTIRDVVWDVVLSRSRRHSLRMAMAICRSMRERVGVHCRGVHGARFVVLREAWMPAVLVEVGYVSNRDEATRLASAAYRQAIAQGIADGVATYVAQLDRTPI